MLLITRPNGTYYYTVNEPAKSRATWEANLDPATVERNAKIRIAMIVLSVLVAVAAVGAIVAMGVAQGMIATRFPIVAFIPVDVLILLIAEGILITIAVLKKPPSSGNNLSKDETEYLFTKASFTELRDYVLRAGLDPLVYEKWLLPDEGEEILTLLQTAINAIQKAHIDGHRQELSAKYEEEWKQLRAKHWPAIQTRLPPSSS